MGEISINPKFNIHETYKKVRILNPYRNGVAPSKGTPITGLVASYNFNETTGDLIDSVNGYNGTLFGSIVRDGSKYTFNGSNTYIEIPENNDFSFNNAGVDVPFTIRLKITFDSFQNGWIINKRGFTTPSGQEWQVYVYQEKLSVSIFDKNISTSLIRKINTTSLVVGISYQIVVKYDGSGNASGLKFILNKDENISYNDGATSISGTGNTLAKVIIGKPGFASLYSKSKIDDIVIYKGYEWTTQDISNDYDAIMI